MSQLDNYLSGNVHSVVEEEAETIAFKPLLGKVQEDGSIMVAGIRLAWHEGNKCYLSTVTNDENEPNAMVCFQENGQSIQADEATDQASVSAEDRTADGSLPIAEALGQYGFKNVSEVQI